MSNITKNKSKVISADAMRQARHSEERLTVPLLLEDIGLQTGSRVGVRLDGARRRIAIRYGNARATGGKGGGP